MSAGRLYGRPLEFARDYVNARLTLGTDRRVRSFEIALEMGVPLRTFCRYMIRTAIECERGWLYSNYYEHPGIVLCWKRVRGRVHVVWVTKQQYLRWIQWAVGEEQYLRWIRRVEREVRREKQARWLQERSMGHPMPEV